MHDSWNRIRRFLKRAVTENLGLKLIAFVVALSLVMLVRMQEKVDSSVEIEVNMKPPPELSGVILTSEYPDKVKVYLRGRKALVNKVKNSTMPPVDMDLSTRVEPGTSTFFFDFDMFRFPPGIEVTRVKPETWVVRIERIISKRLPVYVKLSGRLKNGTRMLDDPKVTPGMVSVTGPAEKMRVLDRIETVEVDIDNREVGAHEVNVPLKRFEGFSYSYLGDVKVQFKVDWRQGRRLLSGLLVNVKSMDGVTAKVSPADVSVALTGPQVALDKLDPALIKVEVELTQENRTQNNIYKVNVTGVPNEIKIKSIVPRTVMVKLSSSVRRSIKTSAASK